MEHYRVTGMSCVVCSGRVEKVVSELEGVDQCSVNLLTNSMTVEGTASSKNIIKAVKKAGYGCKLILKEDNKSDFDDSIKEDISDDLEDDLSNKREVNVLRNRLIFSLGFLIVLMYISMGHVMFGWKVPVFLEHNYIAIAISQCVLALIVMIINRKFFVNGFTSLIHKAPNMDTLVALGSGASFVYSLYGMTMVIICQVNKDYVKACTFTHNLYFEGAAMILALITVGKMFEAVSKGRTTNALRSLMDLSPKVAIIVKDDKEVSVAIEQVKIDDVFVVKPGGNIPVDGLIIEGNTTINEAALTGESIPVDKNVGDSVSAGTLNQVGFIKCKATRVGEDTTLSKIIKMVSDAAASKAPIAKVADKVSGVFVPVVISIAIITFAIWMIIGKGAGFSIARAISVLVISCPCALGLATPVAIMVGNGVGAKKGILFKTAVSLEQTGRTKTVVLDKTGTITKGEPEVTDVIAVDVVKTVDLFQVAYALESKSEHPLAKAVIEKCKTLSTNNIEINDFRIMPGNGLEGQIDKVKVYGGNYKYISEKVEVPKDLQEQAQKFASEGKTPLYFAKGKEFLGIMAIADVIKEDSKDAINKLKNMGIKTIMLTGDNEKTAEAIGKEVGVDEVIAGVLPGGKEKVVRELVEKGDSNHRIIMVGDGINDAPALTRADIGIAIGAGTDVAIDAADVVVMKSSLMDVVTTIRLSKKTLKNIHENLFWAFFYNVIGIPLAAGAFIALFGWELNPMFGAFAMSLSSFCVVSNALRLNFFK